LQGLPLLLLVEGYAAGYHVAPRLGGIAAVGKKKANSSLL
jgi:hypothetical protein